MRRFQTAVAGAIAVLLPIAALSAPETFKIDPGHSQVGFSIRHLLSRVPGRFNTFSGEITVDVDNPSASRVSAEIDTASIDTGNANRDKHLKSPDFFDAEKNPKITYVSTGVTAATKEHATIAGNLTMNGVTKPVTLDVTALGYMSTPQGKWGGFEAKTKINRKDFGIVWNRTLDAGGALLGDDVDITLLIEARVPKPMEPKPPAETKPEGEGKPKAEGKPAGEAKPASDAKPAPSKP